MAYGIMQGGLIFPPPETDWQTNFINTLDPWITCVNSYLSDIGSSSDGLSFGSGFSVTCDGAISASSGSIAGWCIKECYLCTPNMLLDSCMEQIKVGNRDGVYLDIDGTNDRIRTSDFTSGSMGTGWQIATDITEFQNIRARGRFTASVFEKNVVSSVGGSLAILDSAVLESDMTALNSSCITIDGSTTFFPDDILRIKTADEDEWFKVCCNVSGDTYCVERDMAAQYDPDDNPLWQKGTAVINYGQCNTGGILLTSSEVCSPYMSIFTHAGEPWSSLTNKVRIGNLSGVTSGYFGTLSGYGLWAETAYIEGQIQSCSIKLIDPADSANYSCLDGGALKFHDALGDVPYVKRIAGCIACAGDTVILNGWCTAPKILVSPNQLMSYDPTIGGCQSWKIYADTPSWYCTSPTCYGYCFDVHAALETTGSTCSSCTQNAALDACINTYNNVCATCIGMKFQLWTTDTGVDQCYCTGCICYEICYRCNGCAAWQGSCAYTYLQASDSEINLKADCTVYVTLNLPSSECWELMATQTGFSWVQTTLCSGAACSGSCTRTLSAAYNCMHFNLTDGGYCISSQSNALSLTGSNPSGITCNLLCYTWCTAGAGDCHDWYYGAPNVCVDSWGCWEAYIKDSGGTSIVSRTCYKAGQACTSNAWNQTNCLVTIGHTNNITELYMCRCLRMCQCGAFACMDTTNEMCFVSGCLIQCFSSCCSVGATCCTRLLYNTCDITGATCTVDSTGQVNWLAISYS